MICRRKTLELFNSGPSCKCYLITTPKHKWKNNMPQQNWKIPSREILDSGKVVPVMVIKKLEHAVPLARALLAGGIKVLEITLRTPVAIDAIHLISREVPEAVVGAGTVTNPAELAAVAEAGALFAISPGLTPELLEAANQGEM